MTLFKVVKGKIVEFEARGIRDEYWNEVPMNRVYKDRGSAFQAELVRINTQIKKLEKSKAQLIIQYAQIQESPEVQ